MCVHVYVMKVIVDASNFSMCVYICVCLHVCIYVSLCIVRVYLSVYVRLCVWICVSITVCPVSMCLCVYVCLCVCIYEYVYVYMCIYMILCVCETEVKNWVKQKRKKRRLVMSRGDRSHDTSVPDDHPGFDPHYTTEDTKLNLGIY